MDHAETYDKQVVFDSRSLNARPHSARVAAEIVREALDHGVSRCARASDPVAVLKQVGDRI